MSRRKRGAEENSNPGRLFVILAAATLVLVTVSPVLLTRSGAATSG
jgi:hypothetical protein